MTTDMRDAINFHGKCTFANDVVLPEDTVVDANVNSAAAIAASKLQHQHPISVQIADDATAVAAGDQLLHICRSTGEFYDLRAAVVTVATGADRTVTIDVHKSTGGGAFATILTTTIVLDDDSTALTPVAAVVDATKSALVAGDILKLVWTVAGSAGNQAIGCVATANIIED